MNAKKMWVIVVLALVIVGIVTTIAVMTGKASFVTSTNDRDNMSESKKSEMLAIVLTSCNLAPLPKMIDQYDIKTEGNTFTRSFRLSFHADESAINRWVNTSPGLRHVKPMVIGNISKYVLKPTNMAYGEVTIDSTTNNVKVYVAHS